MYKISSCLFHYAELTHLEIHNCVLKTPVTFKGFPRLKSLKKVTVEQDVLENLIICSPSLEIMTLCDLKGIAHLNIDTQNLQFLNVGSGFRRFNHKNSPNLVGMKVARFCGVKAELDFLKALFLSSPLQELEISFGRKIMRSDDNQNCTSTKLRVLKLAGFSGDVQGQINFIGFLLSILPVLEQLSLQLTSAYVSWELTKILEGFRQVKKNFMDPLEYPEFTCSSSDEE